MKSFARVLLFVSLLCLLSIPLFAQPMAIGGRGGISIFNSSAGIQIGPTLDYQIQRNQLLGTQLTINSQSGTPVQWAGYFKYLIDVKASDVTPYVDGGINLWFVTGGPYFGLQFGGGAYFPIGNNLSVPADVEFGPIFSSGSNTFYFAITSGIRYTLPSP